MKHETQPVTIENFITPTRIDFEKIRVSTFTDLSLASSAAADLTPSPKDGSGKNENDRITGRRGEGLVYQYLQWRYPDRIIEWMNKEGETGHPFDIRMSSKDKTNRVDFIEVKTTRSAGLRTFEISIKEVEYLMMHTDNYHIYRVFYTDDEISSTITIVNRIKFNLEKKHLSLCMTIPT